MQILLRKFEEFKTNVKQSDNGIILSRFMRYVNLTRATMLSKERTKHD